MPFRISPTTEVTVIGYATVQDIRLKIPISYEDSTSTVATIPANSVITRRVVVRETPWNVIALFVAGRSDALDLLIKNYQHNLSLTYPGATEITGGPVYVPADLDVIFTWNQGGATAGAGYVIIEYTTLEAGP